MPAVRFRSIPIIVLVPMAEAPTASSLAAQIAEFQQMHTDGILTERELKTYIKDAKNMHTLQMKMTMKEMKRAAKPSPVKGKVPKVEQPAAATDAEPKEENVGDSLPDWSETMVEMPLPHDGDFVPTLTGAALAEAKDKLLPASIDGWSAWKEEPGGSGKMRRFVRTEDDTGLLERVRLKLSTKGLEYSHSCIFDTIFMSYLVHIRIIFTSYLDHIQFIFLIAGAYEGSGGALLSVDKNTTPVRPSSAKASRAVSAPAHQHPFTQPQPLVPRLVQPAGAKRSVKGKATDNGDKVVDDKKSKPKVTKKKVVKPAPRGKAAASSSRMSASNARRAATPSAPPQEDEDLDDFEGENSAKEDSDSDSEEGTQLNGQGRRGAADSDADGEEAGGEEEEEEEDDELDKGVVDEDGFEELADEEVEDDAAAALTAEEATTELESIVDDAAALQQQEAAAARLQAATAPAPTKPKHDKTKDNKPKGKPPPKPSSSSSKPATGANAIRKPATEGKGVKRAASADHPNEAPPSKSKKADKSDKSTKKAGTSDAAAGRASRSRS